MSNMNNYKSTEITAHIADISYTIEQMRALGENEEKIKNFLQGREGFKDRYLKTGKDPYHPNFPENLEYIDSYYVASRGIGRA